MTEERGLQKVAIWPPEVYWIAELCTESSLQVTVWDYYSSSFPSAAEPSAFGWRTCALIVNSIFLSSFLLLAFP